MTCCPHQRGLEEIFSPDQWLKRACSPRYCLSKAGELGRLKQSIHQYQVWEGLPLLDAANRKLDGTTVIGSELVDGSLNPRCCISHLFQQNMAPTVQDFAWRHVDMKYSAGCVLSNGRSLVGKRRETWVNNLFRLSLPVLNPSANGSAASKEKETTLKKKSMVESTNSAKNDNFQ